MLVLAEVQLIFFIVAGTRYVLDLCCINVGNLRMFEFLLSSACTRFKASSAPHNSPLVSKLGMHNKLGGDAAGTVDPKR